MTELDKFMDYCTEHRVMAISAVCIGDEVESQSTGPLREVLFNILINAVLSTAEAISRKQDVSRVQLVMEFLTVLLKSEPLHNAHIQVDDLDA